MKESLLADLRTTRAAIAKDVASVKRELDFQAKIKEVVRHKPLAWFGTAAALGWILSGPKTRTRTVTKLVKSDGHEIKGKAAKAAKTTSRWGILGFLFSLAKFAFPYIQPHISSLATQQLSQWAARHSGASAAPERSRSGR